MKATFQTALLLTFAGFGRGQGLGSCYYPGGAYASGHYPCNKYAYTSVCCPTGWTCFSNNLCIATDPGIISSAIPLGTSMRGTCTNPAWSNSSCGDFCLNEPVMNNDGALKPCGGNKWCCKPESDSGLCNCDTGKGIFSLPPGTAQTIIGVYGLQYTSTGSLSTRVTSATVPSSSSAASSTRVTATTSKTSSTSAATSSIVSTTTPTSSPSSSSSSSASQTSTFSTRTSSLESSSGSSSPTSASNATLANTDPFSVVPITSTLGFKLGLGISMTVVGIGLISFLVWFFRFRKRYSLDNAIVPYNNDSDVWQPNNAATSQNFMPVPHPYEDHTPGPMPRHGTPGLGYRRFSAMTPVPEEENPYWDGRRPTPHNEAHGGE